MRYYPGFFVSEPLMRMIKMIKDEEKRQDRASQSTGGGFMLIAQTGKSIALSNETPRHKQRGIKPIEIKVGCTRPFKDCEVIYVRGKRIIIE